jgi:hypothetical protein
VHLPLGIEHGTCIIARSVARLKSIYFQFYPESSDSVEYRNT